MSVYLWNVCPLGNEVEVKMFSATGWSFEESILKGRSISLMVSPDRKCSYYILKRFEFDHGRQCMSVVVENVQSAKRYIITKGSFEKMASLCRPDTVPIDFVERGKENAMQGGYVLGIARRELFESECPKGDFSALEVLPRDSVESAHSLELLSLLIFRNEPKEESRDAIVHLRRGCVRPVMITGDNAQCGQYICRSCELLDSSSHILLAELNKDTNEISWNFMGGEGASFASSSHHLTSSNRSNKNPSFTGFNTKKTTEEVLSASLSGQLHAADGNVIELAVTGNDTLNILSGKGHLRKLLVHIRMFARMSPEHKSFIVRMFKDAGYTVVYFRPYL